MELIEKINSGNFETEEIELEIINLLKNLRNKGENIGAGMTADVYISENNPKICYKIIERRNIFYNFVEIERKFLEKCKSIGISSPLPVFSYRKGDYEVLAMERIEGNSIEHIIANNLDLPENFNLELFFREFNKMIDILHQNRIYHRDLHWGNVMIEKNGKPCIIDFGSAKVDFNEENSKRSEFINPNTKRREYVSFSTTDENNILETKKKLKAYIRSKNT